MKALEFFQNMEGKWQGQADYIIEEWVVVDDHTCTATVKNMDSNPPIINERIEVKYADGVLTYTGILYDRSQELSIIFSLQHQDNGYVRFENMAHEFPQNIEYWRLDEKTARARISGEQNGKTRKQDFRYTLVE